MGPRSSIYTRHVYILLTLTLTLRAIANLDRALRELIYIHFFLSSNKHDPRPTHPRDLASPLEAGGGGGG